MTFFTTAQGGVAAVWDNAAACSVREDTVTGYMVASSASPYKVAAVRRILKAKSGPTQRGPDDPTEFVDWLEK